MNCVQVTVLIASGTSSHASYTAMTGAQERYFLDLCEKHWLYDGVVRNLGWYLMGGLGIFLAVFGVLLSILFVRRPVLLLVGLPVAVGGVLLYQAAFALHTHTRGSEDDSGGK